MTKKDGLLHFVKGGIWDGLEVDEPQLSNSEEEDTEDNCGNPT
jgi:hypothetical protein